MFTPHSIGAISKSSPPSYANNEDHQLIADLIGSLRVILTDLAGANYGTLSNPVRTNPTGTTAQPISGSVTIPPFTTLLTGQATINPTAAALPTQASSKVVVQSSYTNSTTAGLIIYVGSTGQEVIELYPGDTWTFNVANLNMIYAKCPAAMTGLLNWSVEV